MAPFSLNIFGPDKDVEAKGVVMKKLVLLLASYLVIIGASLVLLDEQKKANDEQVVTAFILGSQYMVISCIKDRFTIIPPTLKQKAKGARPMLVKCDSIAVMALGTRDQNQSQETKPEENPGIDIKM